MALPLLSTRSTSSSLRSPLRFVLSVLCLSACSDGFLPGAGGDDGASERDDGGSGDGQVSGTNTRRTSTVEKTTARAVSAHRLDDRSETAVQILPDAEGPQLF